MYTQSFFQTADITKDNANIKGSGFLAELFGEEEKNLYMLRTEEFIFDSWLVEYTDKEAMENKG